MHVVAGKVRFWLLLPLLFAFAPQLAAQARTRFEIVVPRETHADPITGRVYVMIARSDSIEPRLQIGRTGSPFFGRDIERLISISDVPNTRSHALMQRLGMSYDHTATLSDDRETFDAHIYVLTRQDWLSLGKL